MIGKDGKTYYFRIGCSDCDWRGDWFTTLEGARKQARRDHHRVPFDPPIIEKRAYGDFTIYHHRTMYERIRLNPNTGYGMDIEPKE